MHYMFTLFSVWTLHFFIVEDHFKVLIFMIIFVKLTFGWMLWWYLAWIKHLQGIALWKMLLQNLPPPRKALARLSLYFLIIFINIFLNKFGFSNKLSSNITGETFTVICAEKQCSEMFFCLCIDTLIFVCNLYSVRHFPCSEKKMPVLSCVLSRISSKNA